MNEKEFLDLLNEYWNLSIECYDKISSFMNTPDYEPKGRVPHTNFTYEHQGLGFVIFLDSGLTFEFKFRNYKVAGFNLFYVFDYFEQVKQRFPSLSNITLTEMEVKFKELVNEGKMFKTDGEPNYNWGGNA